MAHTGCRLCRRFCRNSCLPYVTAPLLSLQPVLPLLLAACGALQLSASSRQSLLGCIANSHASFRQRRSSISLSCKVPLLCCFLYCRVHPDGIWLASLGVSGNVLGQVNVPVDATPLSHFAVAFDGFHAEKLTSIDASLLQFWNMF